MIKQPDLFNDYQVYDGQPPAQKHSPTSIAAASSIKQRIGPLHQKILRYLTFYSQGATDETMQLELNMSPNTQRPRRRELELAGWVKDSGRTRLTRSGRSAVVWVLA